MPPSTPLRFAWYVTRDHRLWAAGAFTAVTLASVLEGCQTYILKILVDTIEQLQEGTDSSIHDLWKWGLLYPLLFFVNENIWRTSGFCGMRWITRMESTCRRSLFAYLTDHSSTFFNNRFAGSLTNKISNATRGTHRIMTALLWEFYPLFIGSFVFFTVAYLANPLLAYILAAWLLVFLGINAVMVYRKQHLSYEHATRSSVLKGKMVDTASNISAVHQTGHQSYERDYVERFITDTEQAHFKSWWVSEWILITNGTMLAVFTGLMIGVSIWLIQKGDMTLGSLVMIITIVINFQRNLFFIGSKMTEIMDSYGEVREGLDEILVPHDITDEKDANILHVPNGKVEFSDVLFKYSSEKTVFKSFHLQVDAGQKVGLVGVSGAGKSTLVSLLLRQYDIQSGAITIDDTDIRSVTMESLRSNIAMVPQDTSLFHRTIRENIRYGRLNATDQEVETAAKLAEAHDFIMDLPQQYDTYVGERGVKLSGGQRQRVSFARAIVKNAPILILDEATSSLDSESEAAIQKALESLMKDKTVIAIAHRLSTLKAMDRIIVMDAGRIIEDGTHAELVDTNGIYAKLWSSQVSGFIQDMQ